MSKVLKDLLYASSHEWAKIEGNVCVVGITDYAQKSLGSVVYVEGFENEEVSQFSECGAIESVKAASDIMAPVSGTVIEVNNDVITNPELINNDPYLNWILKIEFSDENELNNLLQADEYEKSLK